MAPISSRKGGKGYNCLLSWLGSPNYLFAWRQIWKRKLTLPFWDISTGRRETGGRETGGRVWPMKCSLQSRLATNSKVEISILVKNIIERSSYCLYILVGIRKWCPLMLTIAFLKKSLIFMPWRIDRFIWAAAAAHMCMPPKIMTNVMCHLNKWAFYRSHREHSRRGRGD